MTSQYIFNHTEPEISSFVVNPYTTDGPVFPTTLTLDSSAISNNTGLLLYGKGMPNYGERIQENILHLQENFFGSSAPTKPISGQLWYSYRKYWLNQTTTTWYVWDGASWVVGSVISSPTAPTPPAAVNGTLWYDGTTLSMYVINATHPLNNKWIVRSFISSLIDPTTEPPELIVRIWNGNSWVPANAVHTSMAEVMDPSPGTLWFDETANQLKIWQGSSWISTANQYVLKAGDTMTGPLQLFGDPTNPLHAATEQYVVPRSGGTMTHDANLAFDGGEVIGLPATPSGPTAAASKQYVDTEISAAVLGSIGTLGSDDIDNDSSVTGITVTNALDTLDSTKLSLSSGGTVTGPVNFINTITSLTYPTNSSDITNKVYVDDAISMAISSIGGTDTYLVSAVLDTNTLSGTYGTLTLTLNDSPATILNVPGFSVMGHTHLDYEIESFPPEGTLLSHLTTGSPFPSVNVGTAITELGRIVTNLSKISRSVDVVVGSPIPTTYVVPTYTVGFNNLSVYVNGVKQIASFQGKQEITLNINEYGCPATGLNPAETYTASILVDGITTEYVSVTGSIASSYCDLVDQINTQVSNARAVFDGSSITIFSNTHGNTSSVVVVDGGGSPSTPLFASLVNFVSISSPINGTDYGYNEVGAYGTSSTTIEFIGTPMAGAVLEFISIGNLGL